MDKRYVTFCFTLALFGIGLVFFGVFEFSALRTIDDGRRDLTERRAHVLAINNSLRFLQAHENETALRFVLSGKESLLAEIDNIRTEFVEKANLLKTLDNDPDAVNQIDAILARKKQLISLEDRILKRRMDGASLEETHESLEQHREINSASLPGDALELFFNYELKKFEAARDRVEKSVKLLKSLLLLTSALILLGFIAVVILFRKYEQNRQVMLKQTQQTAKIRKEILETVAHDLKNPLSTLSMSVELIENDIVYEGSELSELLDVVKRSTTAMQRLVSDLLDHAKIESGRLSIKGKTSNLCDLGHNMIKRFQVLAQEKKINLSIQLPDSPVYVWCDESRVDQLMSNLLGNAIKFTPEQGHVTLKVESRVSKVMISVSDTGKGLSRVERERVFDRYWQAKSTASKGTGLGLAISKAIAEAHKGSLWVESEPGRGATFYFALPLEEKDTSAR